MSVQQKVIQMQGKILRQVKESRNYKKILHKQNSAAISRQVSHASLPDVSFGNCQRVLVDESEMIRIQRRTNDRFEILAVQGSS